VDERSVYVYEPDAISRVDRKSGQSTFLTNDTHFVFEMVPVNGTLYWIDQDGVQEWRRDATTRTTIATFSTDGHGGGGHSLALVSGKLCWARYDVAKSGEAIDGRVDCMDLNTRDVSTRFRATSPLDVASYHERLFVATYSGQTNVFDITDPTAPQQLAELPRGTGDLRGTVAGPTVVQLGRPEPRTTLWIASNPPREIQVAQSGVVRVAGGRSFLLIDGNPPERLDVATGALSPVPHARAGALCGDSDKLYVQGENESLIEVSNR
jgi:hypothetical protein